MDLTLKHGASEEFVLGNQKRQSFPGHSFLEAFLGRHGNLDERVLSLLMQTHCILWTADVYASEGTSSSDSYFWKTEVHNEPIAQLVLPLNIPRDSTYHQAWLNSRNHEDTLKSQEIAANALRSNRKLYTVEFRCHDCNGQEHWLLEQVQLEQISKKQWRAFGICTDVSERRRAEEARRAADLRRAAVIEQATEAIYFVDVQTKRIIESNPAFQQLLGYSSDEAAHLTIYDVVAHTPTDIDQRLSKATMERVTGIRQYRCKNGALVEVESSASLISTSGRPIICTVARDCSERQQIEARINAFQTQLQALVSELSLAEERERRRLASTLHDGLGQVLAVSKMKVESLLDPRNQAASLNPAQSQTLKTIEDLLAESISLTRKLTFELSPPVLSCDGLEAALESLCERNSQDIPTQFIDDKQSKPIEESLRHVVFQAVRELLHNSAKHSQASQICVSVKRVDHTLQVVVEDDGIGCDISTMMAGRHDGFGLFSIRERLIPYGGLASISSFPNTGMCVTLTLPLQDS